MRMLKSFTASMQNAVNTLNTLLLASVLCGLVFAACYDPKIDSGKLRCAQGGKCPEGFSCAKDGLCYASSMVPVGGAGGTGGVGGIGGGIGGMGGTGGMNMCIGPFPGCTPTRSSGSACDPVCQDCGCLERCNFSASAAELRCGNPAGGPANWKKVGDVCGDEASQRDNCAPGSLCLPELTEACGNHCYKYCRTDNDCTNGAHCTVELEFNKKRLAEHACDNPPEPCQPYFGMAKCTNAERQSGAFGCYIMSNAFPNEAVCDCAGSVAEGGTCESQRGCQPGLACVPLTETMGVCRRVCPLANPAQTAVICGVGRKCRQYLRSEIYGYCE